MKYIFYAHVLCTVLLTNNIARATIINDLPHKFHTKIGTVTEKPSNFCAHLVQEPFKKMGEKIAPYLPDKQPDIVLPFFALALYIASTQVIPAALDAITDTKAHNAARNVSDAKEAEKVFKAIKKNSTNPHVKTTVNLFKFTAGLASFHKNWTKNDDAFEWTLKNSIGTLLMTQSAYSIYKTYAPTN